MAANVVRRGGFALHQITGACRSKLTVAGLSRVLPKDPSLGYCSPCLDQQRFLSTSHILSSAVTQERKETKQPEEKQQQLIKIPVNNNEPKYTEHFVPITRRSVVRHLMQEKNFLTAEELTKFEEFSMALDSAVVNKYHGLLEDLKSLFDPINPDKDTISTRELNRRERLDNEFWLLQKLASVMSKANFHELPRSVIEKALAEHTAREGVMVSVNPDKYDILRFWALGKETPPLRLPWYQQLFYKALKRPAPQPLQYYKRVVVAVRLKKDDKLILKAFKEIPINALEQLLPDGKIRMTKFDQGLVATSMAIAGAGVLIKVVTYMAKIHVDWTLILTGLTGFVAFRAWDTYKNRRNMYLLDLNRALYFKNIANNRGLLTLLVDRAEDEMFKEALLVYTFLLASRPPSVAGKGSSQQLPAELGSMTEFLLQKRIEDWVLRKTGSQIQFQALDSVKLLRDFGLLSEDLEGNLHVLPLDGAMRNLPLHPQSLTSRIHEYDIVEGYDRHIVEEPEDEYKEEDKKRRTFGWN